MGKPRYTLTLEKSPHVDDMLVIRQGLNTFNFARAEDDQHQPLVLFVRDNDQNILGGLLGDTFWGWLHVGVLWLADNLRGKGFGRDLLLAAEKEALKRGCHSAFLDTMSFHDALPFYQKCGYTLYAELPDFPLGNTRYFLKKSLMEQSS
jgi:GNAT superfamily N-acetyltransferase